MLRTSNLHIISQYAHIPTAVDNGDGIAVVQDVCASRTIQWDIES